MPQKPTTASYRQGWQHARPDLDRQLGIIKVTKARRRRAKPQKPRRKSTTPKDPTPERVIQKLGIDLLKRTGWTVWRVGQYNARRTQDPGVPDVIAAKGTHLVFVEFKRASGGVQSDAQKAFEDAAVSAGVPYWLISDVQVLAQRLANLARVAA